MATVALYPAVTADEDARDLLTRLVHHLGPVAGDITRLSLVTTFGPLQLAALQAPPALDPSAGPAHLAERFGDSLTLYPAAGTDAAAWGTLFAASDVIIVWRRPGEGDPFPSLDALTEAAPNARIILADPALTDDAAAFASAALALADPSGVEAEAARVRLADLAASLGGATGHIVGPGPSAAQTRHFDLSRGDVVASAALLAQPDLSAALRPKLLCAAGSALYAGPSRASAEMRARIQAHLGETHATLLVPLADRAVHLAALPPALHERVVAVPPTSGDPATGDDIAFMLDIAAALYHSLTVSGADGPIVPPGTLRDLRAAHPGAAFTPPPLEARLAAIEARGIAVTPLTASDRGGLRRRGAAAPLPAGSALDPAAPLTVLALAPDLTDPHSEAFGAQMHLATALAARGARMRIAASRHFRAAAGSEVVVDPVLATPSHTLGTAERTDPDGHSAIAAKVEAEFGEAIDRAAAATPGPILVWLRDGSLDHLACLARLAAARMGVRVLVHLETLRTADIWATDFGARFAPTLAALTGGTGVAASVPTVHQQHALAARTGLTLPVLPQPSALFDDAAVAARLEALPEPPRREGAVRILFPAPVSRPEEGAPLLAEVGAALRRLVAGAPLELTFATDPLHVHPAPDGVRGALGPYTVLPPTLAGAARAEALSAADAAVLTHLPPAFTDRPLGYAIDALHAGTPALACAGTADAAVLAEHWGGRVVPTAEPAAIAEAALTLARARREGTADLRPGIAKSLARNAYGVLADTILNVAPLPEGATWSAAEAAHAEALRQAALPLLTAPPEGTQFDYGRALAALGVIPGEARTLWSGRRTPGDPPALPAGDLLLDALAVFAAHAATPGWTVHDARPASLDPRITRLAEATAAALDDAGDGTAALILERFEPAIAPALWRALARAPRKAVVLGVEAPIFTAPGRVAAHLMEELERLGFVTVLLERGAPPAGGPAPLMRATLGPIWPPRPTARCDVLALAAPVDPAALKAALRGACPLPDPATLPDADPAPLATDGPATTPTTPAPPMSEAATLLAVREPGSEGWQLLSLGRDGPPEAGFRPLAEKGGTERAVHGVTARIEGEAPLTMSFEVQPLTSRYLALSFADPANLTLAEARFDLVEGVVLSTARNAAALSVDPRAAIVAADQPNVWRVSLSLDALDTVGPLLAEASLRQSATATSHHVATSTRRIGLRNLLIERRPVPSTLPPEGIPGLPGADLETEGADATGPQGRAVDLLAREAGQDPRTAWVAGAGAELTVSAERLDFSRNASAYTGQLVAHVDVGSPGPYRLELQVDAVQPQMHVAVSGKVVERVEAAGPVTVEIGATGTTVELELRVANAHNGRFTISAARLVAQ